MNPVTHYAQELFRYGHFCNPEFPDCRNVKEKDLPKLRWSDKLFKQAVTSYQMFDANHHDCCQQIHQCSPHFDGVIGEATRRLMSLDRCGCPDYSPEINKKREEQRRYETAYFNTILASTGDGSWPFPGCNPDDRDYHSVRYRTDWSRATSKQKGYRARVLLGAQQCLAEAGLRVWYTESESTSDQELYNDFTGISGGVIGFFNILTRSTCNQRLKGRLDTGYAPDDWFMFCNLFIHEALGHGIGHEHTSGGIMNPSIRRTPAHPVTGAPTYNNDGSSGNTAWRRCKRWFGDSVPVPGAGPTPPPDPGGTTSLRGEADGTIQRYIDGKPTGERYLITPY
jgi:hypothetical protein